MLGSSQKSLADTVSVRKSISDIIERNAQNSLADSVERNDQSYFLKNIFTHRHNKNVELRMKDIELQMKESYDQVKSNDRNVEETEEMKSERLLEAQFVETMKEIEKKNQKEVSSSSSSLYNDQFEEQKS